jgi:hypothetical protein
MVIEYHEAAFAHDVAEADIESALRTLFFEKPATDGSYLAVGFNRAGNPLEVAYREIDDDYIFVFHAMPCRQKWLIAAAYEGEKYGEETD